MEDVGREIKKVIRQNNWNDKFDELVQDVMQDEDVQAFIATHREQLTEEDIVKSYAKLYEYVQEKRKFKLNDPLMIAPGYEPRLLMNFHFIDVTYVPTDELLAQQAEAAIRSRVKAVAMPRDIREARIDNFEITAERKEALQAGFQFINDYQKRGQTFVPGLYLHGSFGVGKTYLLGALAQELAEKGFKTTLIHFPTFAVEMKQAIATNSTGEKLNAIKEAPILMIDDIGADSMSTWIRDDVLGVILQYRMQEQLATFFSSNFSLAQLEAEHLTVSQRGEDEPLKAKRIMERIRFLSREITMVGVNRRLN